MKYVLGLLILAVALIAASPTSAVSSHDTQTVASAAEPAAEFCSAITSDSESLDSQVTPMTLPSCWNYEGNSCSTPGTSVKCQWQQFEPGRCACGSDHIWHCG